MMRILLTGSSGFVGKQILKSLLAKGAFVTVILRKDQNIPDGVSCVRTDNMFSETTRFWEDSCRNHNAVIHCAWFAKYGKYLNANENLDCLHGTIRLFQGAKAAGISHFQGIGTCLEYDLTTKEVAERKPIPPNAPIYPNTAYAAAKAAAYLALVNHSGEMGFAWSRLFYLYGEGEDRRRLVPYINDRISQGLPVRLTSGNFWRDFLDVEEAGAQIAKVTLNRVTGPLNICSGKPIKLVALAEKIASKYGRQDLIKLDSNPNNVNEPPFVVGVPSLRKIL